MDKLSVRDFYKGKNIFITGATGFVGMALVEKLLRCVPDIGTIYVLVRPKKGKKAQERLEEFFKNSVFDRLKGEESGGRLGKVVAVEGDVSVEDLGLSGADRELLVGAVDVVFHSAASLDFEANLKTTVAINLLGTRRVIQLCQQMTRIKVLLHVSSAYVNSNRREAEEVLYPMGESTPAEKVIELVSSLDDKAIEEITPKVLGTHLNTYTYTKALAEHEVANAMASFPTCIIRPSMIIAAWNDPAPGWTASKNGPQGFMMGAAKGVIRRLPVAVDLIVDYIPVDLVINGIIDGAYSTAVNRPEKTPIYHLTSSTRNPYSWGQMTPRMNEALHEAPICGAVWYPNLKFLPSLLWFRVSAFIYHLLPALLLDTVTRVAGGRPILMRLHENVNRALGLLEPFIFTEWRFDSRRTLELHNSLSEEDRVDFGIDVDVFDWSEMFEKLILGVRQYLNKEKMDNLKAAKRKDSMLWFANMAVQVLFISIVAWPLSALSGFTFTKFLIAFSTVALALTAL